MKTIATFEPAGAFATLEELRAFVSRLDGFADNAQVHLSPRQIEVVHDDTADDEPRLDEPDEGRTGAPGESFGPAARSTGPIIHYRTPDERRRRRLGNSGVRSMSDFAITKDGRVYDKDGRLRAGPRFRS